MGKPTHWLDIEKHSRREEVGVCLSSTVDILKVISGASEALDRKGEVHIKTETYEVRIKR